MCYLHLTDFGRLARVGKLTFDWAYLHFKRPGTYFDGFVGQTRTSLDRTLVRSLRNGIFLTPAKIVTETETSRPQKQPLQRARVFTDLSPRNAVVRYTSQGMFFSEREIRCIDCRLSALSSFRPHISTGTETSGEHGKQNMENWALARLRITFHDLWATTRTHTNFVPYSPTCGRKNWLRITQLSNCSGLVRTLQP